MVAPSCLTEPTINLLSTTVERGNVIAIRNLPESLLFIDGALVAATSGTKYENVGPATGDVIGYAADASAQDMDTAIASARRAFDHSEWSTNRDLRVKSLTQLLAGLNEKRDELRSAIKAEAGATQGSVLGPQCDRTLADAHHILPLLRGYNFAQEGTTETSDGAVRSLTVREPFGVVGAITPWNVPLMMDLEKTLPALAAGCTVVLKAAPETPWTASIIGEVARDTDIPKGVLNVITSGTSAALGTQLTTDPRVDLISFTGSTVTGRHVMASASGTVKKVLLELGGKSPEILLDDANFSTALVPAAYFVSFHAGQGCVIPTRVLVPRVRHDEAVEILRTTLESLQYGDPDDPRQLMGPLVSAKQRDRVLAYIHSGVQQGARLVTGGSIPPHLQRGFYIQPTLFSHVDNGMRIAQEEIFGPVLSVISHDGDDDAVRIANDSPYGLFASVHSSSPTRAFAVGKRLRCGSVRINGISPWSPASPHGGYKQSGLGRERGLYGFEEHLEIKAMGLPAGIEARDWRS